MNFTRRWRSLAAVGGVAIVATVAVFAGGLTAGTGAPVNQTVPVPVGSFQEGGQLQALPLNGSWSNTPTAFAYQWFRVNAVGGEATLIPGASTSTYSPVAADVTAGRILVQVTASNASGISQVANSATVPLFDDAPANTAAPVLQSSSSVLEVGQVITVTQGTWSGGPTGFAYQWFRCNSGGANCAPIAGQTTASYTTVQADQGNTLRALVEATTGGPTAVGRAVTSASAPVGGAGPQNTAKPGITGTAQATQVLTASNGTWVSPNGSPITYTYQWQRCNAQGQQCVNIPGATQQAYTLQQADIGSTIVVVVAATNNQGTQSAASNATGVVGGVPAGSVIPASQVTLSSGNKLSIQSVNYTPNVLSSRAPFNLQVRIGDVQGHFVSGAQVSLVAVPFGRIAPAPTLTSDAQGFVNFSLNPTAQFPLKKGFRITIFVRAVVPGTNVITGPTALRLTSVGINPNR